MPIYKQIWDKYHRDCFEGSIKYDDWLDKYLNIINKSQNKIIDLGCGSGNNALYLTKLGKQVIACDYSDEALKIVKKHLDNVEIKKFDMHNSFPFENDFTDLIIADLCLHYFSNEETNRILNEINRILKDGGHLIFRVNSLNDINHGALSGTEIEKHYFEVDGMKKRFFDRSDLEKVFKNFEIIDLEEVAMTRYIKPKVTWKGIVKKRKRLN
ncbi:MAG: class I SAM-dependent methyltransferase [Bacilli bacterium]|nr:class I SAM-dependent methyltransferase [Bacilli bacterium]MDD4547861.1 class I SAM-dependent methyltransferase [Bacilli bacterium]